MLKRQKILSMDWDSLSPSPPAKKSLMTPTQDKWHCHTLVCDGCQICQCTSLFGKSVRIKGTPESTLKKSNSANSSGVKRSAKKKKTMAATTTILNGRSSCPEMISSTMVSEKDYTSSSASPVSKIKIDAGAIFDPEAQNVTPQKSYDPRILTSKPRCPLEEFDPNSQDSGYGCAYSDEKRPPSSTFQFVEPLKAAPKLRLSLDSPMKSPLRQKQNSSFSANHSVLFRSLSSGYESTDDGFNDLIDMEGLDDEDSGNSAFPNGLSSLITGSLVNNTTPESSKNNNRYFHGRIRRSLSLQIESEAETTPSHKVRSCLFRSPNATSSTAKLTFDENPRSKFKRPEPPSEISPLRVIKKPKICNEEVLQRSYSENDAIKTAMIRDETHDHMTGDFSKPCCLPVIEGGKHHDLKSITVETLAHLLSGKFQHSIEDFQIVDCRYPYEFQGGHIEGAVNLYSREMIEESLLNKLKHTKPKIEADQSCKRQVLIFHCEFSFERGPNLSRVLRSLDRQRNEANYPALHYPEIYLLHGGYRQFFKDEQRWCLGGYCPMRDPKHENELRQYSKNFSKSKSWQEQKQAPTKNLGYKRLGF